MNPDELQWSTLTAERAIRDVLVRYCRGLDRMDESLVASCYHRDATHDHGIFVGTATDFVRYAMDSVKTMLGTMHCLHNSIIDVFGDVAVSETYCIAYHRMRTASAESGEADHVVGLRYIDRFEERDGQWLIAQRAVAFEWSRVDVVDRTWNLPPNAIRGMRDESDVLYRFLGSLRPPMPPI